MSLLAKDEDLRYMALKGFIDSNWDKGEADESSQLHLQAQPFEHQHGRDHAGAHGIADGNANNGSLQDYNLPASSNHERVVLLGLHDTSVLIQDLASTSLVESFCKWKDIAAVYTLFHCLLNDTSLPCTRALKTLLVETSSEGRPISVSLENVEMYASNLVEHQHLIQSIHWDVFVELVKLYTEFRPLDSLFSEQLVPLNPPEIVVKALVPHLSRSLVSNHNFDTQQLIMISELYPYKLLTERAQSILQQCVDDNTDVSVEKVTLCYNLFWFWYTPDGVPPQILDLLDRLKNITKDEGDLNDASDSDEFDISLSEDEDSVPMYEDSQTSNVDQEELDAVIARFQSLIDSVSSSSSTAQPEQDLHSFALNSQPKLYSEILASTPSDSEELLEAWLKEYQDYDLRFTTSIIDQLLSSDFTLFQWQWLITIASRLPTDTVLQFLPQCVTFLKPMKRFVQVIQVGNLKQRQDDALNLRLQLWSLIDSLLQFEDDLALNQLRILTLIIPYLQYGLKDCPKDETFQPVLESILDKLKDHCDPLIITDAPLLRSLDELTEEQHPWIGPAVDAIRFKML
ncbi:unnamed protein product [Kluyveromyces dobzhanskii CBS 2104]|uniref:WGS project CCBQ000000000 data, contig 00107 n=1 Tax=Kluyveromyces dobzhanskii CBS 2104 TaxID=1427455 RepID=A0A0A8L1I6_9SACH|nr:unnamed protein product [Kluyveromyces dobzhanskii CBS 2104]